MKKKVANQHVVIHLLDYQRCERVERFTHVARLIERVHAYAARKPYHISLRTKIASFSTSSP